MFDYTTLSKSELEKEFSVVKEEYEQLKKLGLKLDMSRGKPAPEQLDVIYEFYKETEKDIDFKSKDGFDYRNYGLFDGIEEAKELFAEMFEVSKENVIVGGNSSLNMMFDVLAQAMIKGLGGEPWAKQGKVKFICPAPGYDRHFAVTEYLGIELLEVEMTENGPDMEAVYELVKDPLVKGMWCVPKYSNPLGITVSDETVRKIAQMKPAANDFVVMWDNAYIIHNIYGEGDKLLNLYNEAVKYGNEDMILTFTSTSKISFPGAGVAAMSGSKKKLDLIAERIKYQTIGPNKMNQLRHIKMFKNTAEVERYMKIHADILRPKFDAVLNELDNQLAGKNIASWHKPNGGYFIYLKVMSGCAKRVAELCKEAGMVLTNAGATHPYGVDKEDAGLRIAPSYPTLQEIEKASTVLCCAVKYAACEKLLSK